MNPGGKIYSTDVCVPLSKLPKLVQDTKQDFDACGIRAGLVAHAGDGNYHAGILYSTEEEFEKVKAAHRRVGPFGYMNTQVTNDVVSLWIEPSLWTERSLVNMELA